MFLILQVPHLSTELDEDGFSQLALQGRRHYRWRDVTKVQQKYSILFFRFSDGSARVPLRIFANPDAAIQYVAVHLPEKAVIA